MLKEILWTLLIAFFLTETALLLLNGKNIRKNLNNNIFRDFIDDKTFLNAATYSLVRNQFSIIHLFYKAIILAFILQLNVIPFYLNKLCCLDSIWMQSTWLFLWNFLFGLFFLPLDYISTFKIEKDFGFNRSTRKLWVSDQVKSFFIGACINIPIFALLLY